MPSDMYYVHSPTPSETSSLYSPLFESGLLQLQLSKSPPLSPSQFPLPVYDLGSVTDSLPNSQRSSRLFVPSLRSTRSIKERTRQRTGSVSTEATSILSRPRLFKFNQIFLV